MKQIADIDRKELIAFIKFHNPFYANESFEWYKTDELIIIKKGIEIGLKIQTNSRERKQLGNVNAEMPGYRQSLLKLLGDFHLGLETV